MIVLKLNGNCQYSSKVSGGKKIVYNLSNQLKNSKVFETISLVSILYMSSVSGRTDQTGQMNRLI